MSASYWKPGYCYGGSIIKRPSSTHKGYGTELMLRGYVGVKKTTFSARRTGCTCIGRPFGLQDHQGWGGFIKACGHDGRWSPPFALKSEPQTTEGVGRRKKVGIDGRTPTRLALDGEACWSPKR